MSYYRPCRVRRLDPAQRAVAGDVMGFVLLPVPRRDGVYDVVGEKIRNGVRYTLVVLAERDMAPCRAVALLDKRTAMIDPAFSAHQLAATWEQMAAAA